jgi:hypothetical protein
LSASRPGQRAFRFGPIEERDRGLDAEDAANLAWSGARRLRASQNFGLRESDGDRPPAAENGPRSHRVGVPAVRHGPVWARSNIASMAGKGRRRHGGAQPAIVDGSTASEKNAASAACARPRSTEAETRSASNSRTSRSARRRSNPAASPAASRR